MNGITVAIAGTGVVCNAVAEALLSPAYYPSKISRDIILIRDLTKDAVKALIAFSVTATAVEGVDVLVNALGGPVSVEIKNQYAKAAAEAGVKVYFPSEFGVDERVHVFDHTFFDAKHAHFKYASTVNGSSLKVIAFHVGFFLEDSLIPAWGFDAKNKLYQPYGPRGAPILWTAIGDIAPSVAEVSLKATANRDAVPSELRISGDVKSFKEIANIVGRHGEEKIEVRGLDWDAKRVELDKETHGAGLIFEYLKLIIGSGKVDYGDLNDNEIVNPGQANWRWKIVEDYIRETNGLQS